MDPVISQIRQELKNQADPEIWKTSQRFFKEEIQCYGVKTATVIAIAKKYWKEVKGRQKQEIFSLCEELYQSGYMEESFIVSNWAYALSGRYEREDLPVFRHWIETYITNWASCDGFCTILWEISSNNTRNILKNSNNGLSHKTAGCGELRQSR